MARMYSLLAMLLVLAASFTLQEELAALAASTLILAAGLTTANRQPSALSRRWIGVAFTAVLAIAIAVILSPAFLRWTAMLAAHQQHGGY